MGILEQFPVRSTVMYRSSKWPPFREGHPRTDFRFARGSCTARANDRLFANAFGRASGVDETEIKSCYNCENWH
jgi:hypothetical protein